MSNSLKGKKLYVYIETPGSQQVITFGNDTKGTVEYGMMSTNITWAESWNGDSCYLWVVFDEQIQDSIIRIWGIELTSEGNTISGKGMSAFGNASPQDLSNTTFMNDNLKISSSPFPM